MALERSHRLRGDAAIEPRLRCAGGEVTREDEATLEIPNGLSSMPWPQFDGVRNSSNS
jgi:hypothetical protein